MVWHLGPGAGGGNKHKKKKDDTPLLRLVDLAINAWLKSSRDPARFENELTTCVPHTLYRRILCCLMTLKKHRPLLVMRVLKCWPEPTLGIGSIDPGCLEYADTDIITIQEEEENRYSKRIMMFVEAFLYSLSHGSNRRLKMLKLHAPDSDEYHRMLRKTLKRCKSLMLDLEETDPECELSLL